MISVDQAQDILGLVERIQKTREAMEEARTLVEKTREASRAAEKDHEEKYREFRLAENALLVAAGGQDCSWQLGVTQSIFEPTVEVIDFTGGQYYVDAVGTTGGKATTAKRK